MNESVVYDHAMSHALHTSYTREPHIKSLALSAPPLLVLEHEACPP